LRPKIVPLKLTFSLTADPEKVFQYLSQPELFVSVHPVVYKMEAIGPDKYRVFEKIRLGFIPYSFNYEAEMSGDRHKQQVHVMAVVQKHTRIEMLFSIKPGNNGTVVEEELRITSPLPIRGFMEKFIRRQHNFLFANIDKQPDLP
jgi:carbon monoxide dehydrogenase subunit G